MKQGKLIVLEGISGAGKTTLARNWVKILKDIMPVVYLHGALSDTPIGQRFKKEVQSGELEAIFIYYYLADLFQLTQSYILPQLRNGYIVIQDRYVDSVISFHRAFTKMNGACEDIKPVIDLYTEVGLLAQPEVTIWFDTLDKDTQNRLNVKDESHHKYIKNPLLSQSISQEFAKLMNERIQCGQTVHTLRTDQLQDFSFVKQFIFDVCEISAL